MNWILWIECDDEPVLCNTLIKEETLSGTNREKTALNILMEAIFPKAILGKYISPVFLVRSFPIYFQKKFGKEDPLRYFGISSL